MGHGRGIIDAVAGARGAHEGVAMGALSVVVRTRETGRAPSEDEGTAAVVFTVRRGRATKDAATCQWRWCKDCLKNFPLAIAAPRRTR